MQYNVSARSVGKGKNELTENEKKLALDVINRKMKKNEVRTFFTSKNY